MGDSNSKVGRREVTPDRFEETNLDPDLCIIAEWQTRPFEVFCGEALTLGKG
jgi:hypothetical protein